MQKDKQILSEIVIHTKYARFIKEKNRRETWFEIVDRYISMMKKKYPNLIQEIDYYRTFIEDKKVLPSMRALQFAGLPIEKNHSRIYNCAYLPINHYKAFSETMFLLLGGTGVGYSVQSFHIQELPCIKKPKESYKFLVGDCIEGWADAVKALMKAYLYGYNLPKFDFSDIREKGATLVTAGGKAPGHEPLMKCLSKIENILKNKELDTFLADIECHDILCHIADAVLAGGIRRAAMISLFDCDSEAMLTCKSGNWWEQNEQRGRANNSAVLDRKEITEIKFWEIWKKVEASFSGEPGLYFTSNKDNGTNPCCEISLRPNQFCNLTEVNVSNVENERELHQRIKAATFFGTLQAGFTDLHYLRPVWKKTTEEEALIGVGMTGIGSGSILNYDLETCALLVKSTNTDIARKININPAARATTVKPAGTTSLVLGVSSGIHAWFSEFYIRRMRIGKNEPIYKYLKQNLPSLIEDDVFKPEIQAVLSIPQRAPKGSIVRAEPVFDFLERIKNFNKEWVRKGHRSGDNTNNVSATVSIKDGEWLSVGKWMWGNKDSFNGLSVLPYDGGSYQQAPFEEITEEEYNALSKHLSNIDLSQVQEFSDNTNQSGEIACVGGSCEII